jgi:hypothetical protein
MDVGSAGIAGANTCLYQLSYIATKMVAGDRLELSIKGI